MCYSLCLYITAIYWLLLRWPPATYRDVTFAINIAVGLLSSLVTGIVNSLIHLLHFYCIIASKLNKISLLLFFKHRLQTIKRALPKLEKARNTALATSYTAKISALQSMILFLALKLFNYKIHQFNMYIYICVHTYIIYC